MAKDLISDGLAVSYFYNFVKRMFDNLSDSSVVKFKAVEYAFKYDDASLEIIIPRTLNEAAIEKCKQFVFQNSEVRLSIESGRDMSFFVENLEKSAKKAVDFPTTLAAIIEFLRIDLDNLTGFIDLDTDTQEWKEREVAELDKFKEILEFLIENYSTTNGKATVRYLD
ncbi:MAG: STING domain-containing protein [Bacteroidota bacterium]